GPGRPELLSGTVHLPEPGRTPTRKEVAVIRGWADSLALTAACHDPKVHSKLQPRSGPGRIVFEAIERARIDALGCRRMVGMAQTLTAKTEDIYSHVRFANIKDRVDAPLEDALGLIIRERLTGFKPPENARALVEAWRPLIEERAGDALKRMESLADSQEGFG